VRGSHTHVFPHNGVRAQETKKSHQ